jgi:hypothetical protein
MYIQFKNIMLSNPFFPEKKEDEPWTVKNRLWLG